MSGKINEILNLPTASAECSVADYKVLAPVKTYSKCEPDLDNKQFSLTIMNPVEIKQEINPLEIKQEINEEEVTIKEEIIEDSEPESQCFPVNNDNNLKVEFGDQIKREEVVTIVEETTVDERGRPLNFHCIYCDFKTTLRRYLNRHVKRMHVKSQEQIEQEKEKLRIKQLKEEQKQQQQKQLQQQKKKQQQLQESLLKCSKCTFFTIHEIYLKNHMLLRHSKKERVKKIKREPKKKVRDKNKLEALLCNDCSFSTPYLLYFKRHMRRKHPPEDEREVLTCHKCFFKTKRKASIIIHIQRQHEMDEKWIRKFRCNECWFRVFKVAAFKRHIREKHPPDHEKTFKSCYHCGYTTRIKLDLLLHIQRTHMMEQKSKYKKCYSSSKTVTKLTPIWNKLTTLDDKMKYIYCDQCDFKSVSQSTVKRHTIVTHPPSESGSV